MSEEQKRIQLKEDSAKTTAYLSIGALIDNYETVGLLSMMPGNIQKALKDAMVMMAEDADIAAARSKP